MSIATINTPITRLNITTNGCELTHINFDTSSAKPTIHLNALVKKIAEQLHQYFQNASFPFNLSLKTQGTPFQQQVWEALQRIPVGQTKTYGELANELHTSPRAIGNACRANPIAIIIPCHRIVGINHLGGYAGNTYGKLMNIKSWLLKHEQKNINC